MDDAYFRQKALVFANQIFPHIDGDDLIAEADRIFAYISSNKYQNFIGLNMVADDVLCFAEMLFLHHDKNNQLSPLCLRDYQRKLLADWQTGSDSMVIHARQMGMSLCLSLYALWLISFKPEVHLGFVVPSRMQMDFINRFIVNLHRNCGMALPDITQNNRNSIRLASGNKIQFLLPSTLVVGHSLTHVIAENVAQIPYGDDENFYNTIMFSNQGQLIAASTPAHNFGIFYDLATSKIINTPAIKLPWSLNPEWDAKWAARIRSQIGDEAFENQYECQFIDVSF